MNGDRPKAKLRKRKNKAAAKIRKLVLLKALDDAKGLKPAKVKKAPLTKKIKVAKVKVPKVVKKVVKKTAKKA